MSQSPPQPPEQEPLGPPPPRGGGSVVLGIVVGVVFFAGIVGLSLVTLSSAAIAWLPASLVLAYLVVAIVLAARRRTARFGAGLAIAIGIALLIGAGLCVALLSQLGH